MREQRSAFISPVVRDAIKRAEDAALSFSKRNGSCTWDFVRSCINEACEAAAYTAQEAAQNEARKRWEGATAQLRHQLEAVTTSRDELLSAVSDFEATRPPPPVVILGASVAFSTCARHGLMMDTDGPCCTEATFHVAGPPNAPALNNAPAVPEKPQEAVAWADSQVDAALTAFYHADVSEYEDEEGYDRDFDGADRARMRAALAVLYGSRVALWTCPDCGFGFDAAHTNEPNGGYSCPVCELAALRASVKRTPPSRGISYE